MAKDNSAPMEFPEGKYSINDTLAELAKSPEALAVITEAVKLATGYKLVPGEGMWNMVKNMSPASIMNKASGIPESVFQSLNAKLIQIDKV